MKVELLAPAGSYEGMKAVLAAGADAVYLGGKQFGARAYANNLSQEEMIAAIHYVHLHGKKLYLTVNTLLKEEELEQELYPYLEPFYQEGLDAVIVQDLGAVSFIRRNFPDLPIHASTQMTITGVESAKLLQTLGATRVVTARELSLDEISAIYEETHMEIESFVHGALCYSYSGMCLFSSLIGGRSGNRGRCAQPCRLPYEVEGKKGYPLSPKDMCTVELLPQIIEAGVHSLKIEGRMKKAEYAAGVTRIYRKYLDLYENTPQNYRVHRSDLQELRELYHRDGFSQGYYQVHNGKDMIAFIGKEKEDKNHALFEELKQTYLLGKTQEKIQGRLWLYPNSPLRLELQYQEKTIQLTGEEVEWAQNQPLEESRIRKQMQKTGNTPFVFENLTIVMKDSIFVSMQALNELRRRGLEALEEAVLAPFRRSLPLEKPSFLIPAPAPKNQIKPLPLYTSVETKEQWKVVLSHPAITGIYYNYALLSAKNREAEALSCIKKAKEQHKKFYLSLPHIVRGSELEKQTHTLLSLIKQGLDGFLVRNLETFSLLKKIGLEKQIILDYTVYSFNNEAESFWQQQGVALQTIPLELNAHEIKRRHNEHSQMMVYGYCSMMISTQCVQKTLRQCNHQSATLPLKDRYGQHFYVSCYCDFCYNVIYNSIPLGLLKEYEEIEKLGVDSIRLAFTIETEAETRKIADAFVSVYENGQKVPEAMPAFTKGHFKRGVE